MSRLPPITTTFMTGISPVDARSSRAAPMQSLFDLRQRPAGAPVRVLGHVHGPDSAFDGHFFGSGMTISFASRGARTHASTLVFVLPGFRETRCRHPPGS